MSTYFNDLEHLKKDYHILTEISYFWELNVPAHTDRIDHKKMLWHIGWWAGVGGGHKNYHIVVNDNTAASKYVTDDKEAKIHINTWSILYLLRFAIEHVYNHNLSYTKEMYAYI